MKQLIKDIDLRIETEHLNGCQYCLHNMASKACYHCPCRRTYKDLDQEDQYNLSSTSYAQWKEKQ